MAVATGSQRSSETGELSSHPDATVRSRVLGGVAASNGDGSVHDLGVLPDGLVDSGDSPGDVDDLSVDHNSLGLGGGLATDVQDSEGGGQLPDGSVESADSPSDNTAHDVDGGGVVDVGSLVDDVVDDSADVHDLSADLPDGLSDDSDLSDDVNSGGLVLDGDQLVGEVNDLLSEHGGLLHELLIDGSLDVDELPDGFGEASASGLDVGHVADHSVDVGDLLAVEVDSALEHVDSVDVDSSLGASRGGVDLVDENSELLEDSSDVLLVDSDGLLESSDDLSHDEGSARNERDGVNNLLVDGYVTSDDSDLASNHIDLAGDGRPLRLGRCLVRGSELLDDMGKVSDLLHVVFDHILGVVDEGMSLAVDNSGLLIVRLRLRPMSGVGLLAALFAVRIIE